VGHPLIMPREPGTTLGSYSVTAKIAEAGTGAESHGGVETVAV